MFYQLIVNNNMYWAHAMSHDLIHWEDLPIALYPGRDYRCWSGGTCVDGDRVIAMFYGQPEGIMVATSSDPMLLNWETVQREAVIPLESIPKAPADGFTVPDPFVWKEDGKYFALVGGITAHPVSGDKFPQMYLYTSTDLHNWEYEKGFLSSAEFCEADDDGACPYFMPIGDKRIIMHYSHRHGTRYILGEYDSKTYNFTPVNGGAISRDCWFGGVHAPSIFPVGEDIVAMFNINCSQWPVTDDNMMMVLPRIYTLSGSNKTELSVNVTENVESLRGKHTRLENITVSANSEFCIDEIRGRAMEIIAVIKPDKIPVFEMKVLCSADDSEYTKIQFYPRRGDRCCRVEDRSVWKLRENHKSTIVIDASHGSLRGDIIPAPPAREDVYIDSSDNIKLRVFIDNSIVEVYVNDRATAAIRTYPTRADADRIKFYSRGRDAEILTLDAWEMKSIF